MTAGPFPCAACGQPVQAGATACPRCGTPVGASPARADAVAGPGPEAGTDSPEVAPADLVAAVEADPASDAGDGMASGGIVPGGLLAPSSVHRPAPGTAQPGMPLASSPGVGMAAPGPWSPVAAAPSESPGAASGAAKPVEAGRASLFADLPFDAPDTLAEWLVAIGSVVAAISFLLPWAPGIADYTSSWGLGKLSHLPLLAILAFTAVLAILPNRVAVWVRSGVLPLFGGSMLLGILWPYVAGDWGAEFGSVIATAAALVLVVGGVIGVAPRKPKADPA